MKRWSGQLFPIILLGLLAALSFWLEKAVDLPASRHDGKLRHDPDTVVERFTIRRLSAEGDLQYRLDSPRMQHYADDDSSLIEQPKLAYFKPGTPNLTVQGKFGYVSAQGDTVYFWDEVSAYREASNGRAPMLAKMPTLVVQPRAGTAFSTELVEIMQGKSWLKGRGFELDNNNSTMVLQSQVTGLYYRPKVSQ